ncbi:MAG: hypothetical protein R3F46_02715 [bacterium]
MTSDFRIALYTSLLDTEHSRLGHLWHRSKNSQPPEWYGQPWPELDPVFAAQSVVHRVGSHEFSLSSATRRRRSTGLLTSVLRSFGVLDFQMERLRERSFTAKLSLVDYVRPTLAPAALSRLIGYSVPPTFSGGHWFACQAQHQAMSGTLELAYDRSDGYDLAAALEVRSNPDNQGSGTGDQGPGGATLDVAQPGNGGPMSVGRADNGELGMGTGGAALDAAQPGNGGPMSVGRADNAESGTGNGGATLDVAQPGNGGPMSVGRADNGESGNGDRRTDNGAATPDPTRPERVAHSGILPESAAHADPASPAPRTCPPRPMSPPDGSPCRSSPPACSSSPSAPSARWSSA